MNVREAAANAVKENERVIRGERDEATIKRAADKRERKNVVRLREKANSRKLS